MTALAAIAGSRTGGVVDLPPNDPDAISPEWQQLAAECEAPPFLWPGWVRRWADAFAGGDLELIEAREGGRLTGVLPLLRRGGILAGASNEHTPLFGALARDPETAVLLFGTALDRCRGVLDVCELDEDGCAALASAAARRGLACRMRTTRRAPVIGLADDWEAYRQGISKGTWRTVRRTRQRLGALGPVTTEWHLGGERLAERLAEGLALEASGWKGEQGTAIVSQAATVRFYSSIASWAAANGMLRLGFLRAGGRAVAFKLGLAGGGALYPLKAGVDRAAPGSPGILLTYETVLRAREEGLARIELGGREEPHKLRWSTGSRPLARARVYARTAAGQAARLRRTVVDPVAKRLAGRAR